ncbi:hypothetical protein BH09BAC2_BH09BAC2_01070 [soil metagenome]
MKKFLIACTVILFAASCKKTEILGLKEDLKIGSYLTFVSKTKASIDPDKIATDSINVTVKAVGLPVDKINVYIVRNKQTPLDTIWKLIKTVKYVEGGTKIVVTSQQIATALGIALTDIQPGDSYTIYNEIVTTDGRKFSTKNTNADFEGQPAYNMAMHFNVVVACPVTNAMIPTLFEGEFVVLQDDWEDFFTGDIVMLHAGPGENQFSMTLYPAPFPASGGGSTGVDRHDLVVTIGDDGLTATLPKQYYGQYTYPGYPNDSFFAIGSGEVSSCKGKGSVTLSVEHLYEGKSVGYTGFIIALEQK